MDTKSNSELARLEQAARAAWLYYVAKNTQDEIAQKLEVSRQSAQRLVALAVSEGLIQVRLDHPIAKCMELGHQLTQAFNLLECEIVPSDPADSSSVHGLAQGGASVLERYLKSEQPKTLAFGTGRALKACIDELPSMQCPQHKIVSLLGNMMLDGSASAFDIVVSIFELVKQADATFVGIGHMGIEPPLLLDGFINQSQLDALVNNDAIGEIISWVYNQQGQLLDNSINQLVMSSPLNIDLTNPVYGIAAGQQKVDAIFAALQGRLINSLITNEYTAERLLAKLK